MKNRFLIFAYNQYDAQGGMGDLKAVVDTNEEALEKEYELSQIYNYTNIVDLDNFNPNDYIL
jgi:hypothetical protein